MDVKKLLKSKKAAAITATLATASVLYLVLRLIIPDYHPISLLMSYISDYYLNISLKLSLTLIKWFGYFSLFPDHISDIGQTFLIFFTPSVRYKKMVLIVLTFIWLTKAPTKRKTSFSLLVLLVHFTAVTFYNCVGLSCTQLSDPELVFSVPDTAASFTLFTCLVFWFKINSQSINNVLLKLKIDINGLKSKIIALTVIIYIYIIINQFVFAYFSFSGWVNFLFIPAQKILSVFGYDAIVNSTYLIGNNGTIYMAKFCLGIKTMYLFASIVYLTGRKNITRWLYIFAGLVFINFFNILRFVFLFIHIQKHGDYTLAMDLHDLYNLILYSIVFILWVFWFEKYSDIIPEKTKIAH
jgi:exosortase/archaeosortase family protein